MAGSHTAAPLTLSGLTYGYAHGDICPIGNRCIPYTLHPTPYTLTPYTLYPAPYILHPNPQTGITYGYAHGDICPIGNRCPSNPTF